MIERLDASKSITLAPTVRHSHQIIYCRFDFRRLPWPCVPVAFDLPRFFPHRRRQAQLAARQVAGQRRVPLLADASAILSAATR
jgi:hypothetical protein